LAVEIPLRCTPAFGSSSLLTPYIPAFGRYNLYSCLWQFLALLTQSTYSSVEPQKTSAVQVCSSHNILALKSNFVTVISLNSARYTLLFKLVQIIIQSQDMIFDHLRSLYSQLNLLTTVAQRFSEQV
jgi:hypothetical protein